MREAPIPRLEPRYKSGDISTWPEAAREFRWRTARTNRPTEAERSRRGKLRARPRSIEPQRGRAEGGIIRIFLYFYFSPRVIDATGTRPVKSSSSSVQCSGNTSRKFVLGGLFQLRSPSPQSTVRGVIPRSFGSRSRIQGSRYSSAWFSLVSSPHCHAWCFVDVGHEHGREHAH